MENFILTPKQREGNTPSVLWPTNTVQLPSFTLSRLFQSPDSKVNMDLKMRARQYNLGNDLKLSMGSRALYKGLIYLFKSLTRKTVIIDSS